MAKAPKGKRKPNKRKGGKRAAAVKIGKTATEYAAKGVSFLSAAALSEGVNALVEVKREKPSHPALKAGMTAAITLALAYGASKIKAAKKYVGPILMGGGAKATFDVAPVVTNKAKEIGGGLAKPKQIAAAGSAASSAVSGSSGITANRRGEIAVNNRVRDLVN